MPGVTVIIPALNEASFIGTLLRRVYETGLVDEVIVVDDGSRDGTESAARAVSAPRGLEFRLLSHPKTLGKGAAVRTGLAAAGGDLVLIQDADLEYDPADYEALLKPFDDLSVTAVYGSRNLRPNPRSSFLFHWGGRLLSSVINLLYGSKLTDVATGYKVFRRSFLSSLALRENGFAFCPEATAKTLAREVPILEVPISYSPRGWAEGKKIRWRHGVEALWVMLRVRVSVWRRVDESSPARLRGRAST